MTLFRAEATSIVVAAFSSLPRRSGIRACTFRCSPAARRFTSQMLQHLSPLDWDHINLKGGLQLAVGHAHRSGQVPSVTKTGRALACDS